MPKGSSDKLYEITPDLQQIIRAESIGGTPANRLIQDESGQLFIGPHAIGQDGTVLTIPYSQIPEKAAIPTPLITSDAASLIYQMADGKRWRLPRGEAAIDGDAGLSPARLCREVCTERNFLSIHGTFYELPARNAGGFAKIRPLSTHGRRIHDFASYRGLLVFSGVLPDAVTTPTRRPWCRRFPSAGIF